MTLFVAKSSQKIWATSFIFKKVPTVNKRLIVENPPNLVTLPSTVSVLQCTQLCKDTYVCTWVSVQQSYIYVPRKEKLNYIT
jgi:hypothetical protein